MIDPSDRWAIHELIGLYGHVIDDRRWSDLGIVFTDDVVFDAEPVKDFETTTYDFFCTSVSIVGLLIHAAVGSLGGLGRRLPNRHGLAA
jgi:hypothetical protein